MNCIQELSTLNERYDIHPQAILKTDLLRRGLRFSENALVQSAHFKEKSYFIFSFDMVEQKELTKSERHSAPEEIALNGGPLDFSRTIVSVRLNPNSPYLVEWKDDHFELYCGEEFLAEVSLNERPAYYKHNLKNGKPVSDIAPTIEWGYLIYLTAFRVCQYWGEKEECQFCDINNNYRQQKRVRSYTGVKDIEDVLEAFEIINEFDTERHSTAYTVTGGSITSELSGLNEGQFYAQYAQAIEDRFPGRWLPKAVVQALPLDEVKMLKDSGYQIYHPNYEVWDPKLFSQICPGKDRYVGRNEWIKRIVDAAEIFGASNVIPNFVAGIEMSQPGGFTSVEAAVKSTREGLDFFMSKGILPRFTVWCVEPNTVLSRTNTEPAPLEYYIHLLQSYREAYIEHAMPTPPGYGAPGLGKAVFSVSAFMDVLPEERPSQSFDSNTHNYSSDNISPS
ncbi:MAG: hypothetical protein KDD66_15085 [Bdellovibrionales bacterium]|nr:hypothetical protein [Bdellovibrionales bacterium]